MGTGVTSTNRKVVPSKMHNVNTLFMKQRNQRKFFGNPAMNTNSGREINTLENIVRRSKDMTTLQQKGMGNRAMLQSQRAFINKTQQPDKLIKEDYQNMHL